MGKSQEDSNENDRRSSKHEPQGKVELTNEERLMWNVNSVGKHNTYWAVARDTKELFSSQKWKESSESISASSVKLSKHTENFEEVTDMFIVDV